MNSFYKDKKAYCKVESNFLQSMLPDSFYSACDLSAAADL